MFSNEVSHFYFFEFNHKLPIRCHSKLKKKQDIGQEGWNMAGASRNISRIIIILVIKKYFHLPSPIKIILYCILATTHQLSPCRYMSCSLFLSKLAQQHTPERPTYRLSHTPLLRSPPPHPIPPQPPLSYRPKPYISLNHHHHLLHHVYVIF
jgi:hypothetical protein